jgi:PHD/YefM family antitoxin component YafN of YafNO toxin-antitoxin module
MSNIKIMDASQQLPELVKRASQSREVIMLRDEGKIEAVLVGVEVFEELIGIRENARDQQLMPIDTLTREFKKALEEAGYDSREKIIELVREVKREMADERWQKYL